MKRFVTTIGAVALLALIGCTGGSWEETNALNPVADGGPVSGGTSENAVSVSAESSSSADARYSEISSVDVSAEPASSSLVNDVSGPEDGLPKGGVSSSSAMAVSPSSYAVPSSSAAFGRSSSAAATNLPTTSSDSSGKAGNPTSSETDSTYIPYDPPVVETVTIGSQVWMKKLAAGGQALTWEAAMAAGVCPAGFHVPTYGEVDSLLHMAADGSIVASENDEIGIITGGSKRVRDLGWSEHFGGFWTAATLGGSSAYYFVISATDDDATLHGDLVFNEYYVRCIKN